MLRARRDLLIAMAVAMGVLAALLLLPTPDAGTARQVDHSYVFSGALVFDGIEFLEQTEIWVEQGTIKQVGQKLDVPANVRRIDASGHTLLPGNAVPARYAFQTTSARQNVVVPLAAVPDLDVGAISGIVFSAGPRVGKFRFQLDDVTIE